MTKLAYIKYKRGIFQGNMLNTILIIQAHLNIEALNIRHTAYKIVYKNSC